jgi:hypothetical protein
MGGLFVWAGAQSSGAPTLPYRRMLLLLQAREGENDTTRLALLQPKSCSTIKRFSEPSGAKEHLTVHAPLADQGARRNPGASRIWKGEQAYAEYG